MYVCGVLSVTSACACVFVPLCRSYTQPGHCVHVVLDGIWDLTAICGLHVPQMAPSSAPGQLDCGIACIHNCPKQSWK